ncbi:MAG TPA: NUDIX hydrolase, partial [Phytomonospora sp.]
SRSLEIPRGFGEPGATAAENAERELGEELGAAVVCLTPLGEVHADAAMSGEPVALFHAEIDRIGELGTAEGIGGVRLVPPAELASLIAAGAVTDGYTLAAYLRASLNGLL